MNENVSQNVHFYISAIPNCFSEDKSNSENQLCFPLSGCLYQENRHTPLLNTNAAAFRDDEG